MIWNPDAPPKLFDLETDPSELSNVAADHPDRVAKMAKVIDAEIADQKRRRQLHLEGAAAGNEADAKTLQELKALGYTDADSKKDDDHER